MMYRSNLSMDFANRHCGRSVSYPTDPAYHPDELAGQIPSSHGDCYAYAELPHRAFQRYSRPKRYAKSEAKRKTAHLGQPTALLPFLRELQRFNTISHPIALPQGLLSGSLTFTGTGLHLHRTAFGAVLVSPASKRHLCAPQVRCDLSGHTLLCWAGFLWDDYFNAGCPASQTFRSIWIKWAI